MSSATASKAGLVGRPLVPFFDQEENVNDRLVLKNHEHETMDVDARVWNKELGYFVYPNEESHKQQPRSDPGNRTSNKNNKQNGKKKNGGNECQVSAPITIKSRNKTKGKTTDDLVTSSSCEGSGAPKQLLTPSMLSSSAPGNPTHLSLDGSSLNSSKNEGEQRSKSRKCGSKTQAQQNQQQQQQQQQKPNGNSSRSSTPQRTKKEGNTSSTIDPSVHTGVIVGGVGGTAQENKKGKNKKNQNKQDLSKSGKWAWSAFQSSPDPKALPLPPFLDSSSPPPSGGVPSTNEAATLPPPPPLPPSLPTSPPLPSQPPAGYPAEGAPPLPPMPPADGSASGGGATLEASMTQDLRRLLNIGGM